MKTIRYTGGALPEYFGAYFEGYRCINISVSNKPAILVSMGGARLTVIDMPVIYNSPESALLIIFDSVNDQLKWLAEGD